jgi:hypothetical protein
MISLLKKPNSGRILRDQAQQDMQMQGTANRINRMFDDPSRPQQYGDFLRALREQYQFGAGEGMQDASRYRRFQMARRGVTGGSADVDSARRLRDEYQGNLLAGEQNAMGQVRSLMSQDNQQRLGLLSMGQNWGSGMNSSMMNAMGSLANLQTQRSLMPAQAAMSMGAAGGRAYTNYRQQQQNWAGQRSAFQG